MGIPLHLDPEKSPDSLYEGIEYKDFWVGDSKNKLNQLEQILVRQLLPISGQRILDIGCGYGRLADCYLDRFQQVVMFDGSISLLRQAQEVAKERAIYIAGDVNRLPFCESSFDCVLMIRVFHHVEDSISLLQNINHILANQSSLVFNYSNKRNPRFVVRWLLGKVKANPITLNPVGIGTTLIQHHPKDVHLSLTEAGYSIGKYLGAGVMDKFPDIFRKITNSSLLGERVAPVLGQKKLAPWIMCRAIAQSNPNANFKTDLDEILVCPICNTDLRHSSTAYSCQACDKNYPINNGIIDFRV
jgi:SAM-dependent methyltransferase